MRKKYAKVNTSLCVACGVCQQACPKNAISVVNGCYATANEEKCVGCSICAKKCPASVIEIITEGSANA